MTFADAPSSDRFSIFSIFCNWALACASDLFHAFYTFYTFYAFQAFAGVSTFFATGMTAVASGSSVAPAFTDASALGSGFFSVSASTFFQVTGFTGVFASALGDIFADGFSLVLS